VKEFKHVLISRCSAHIETVASIAFPRLLQAVVERVLFG